jgi:hypothetical protein
MNSKPISLRERDWSHYKRGEMRGYRRSVRQARYRGVCSYRAATGFVGRVGRDAHSSKRGSMACRAVEFVSRNVAESEFSRMTTSGRKAWQHLSGWLSSGSWFVLAGPCGPQHEGSTSCGVSSTVALNQTRASGQHGQRQTPCGISSGRIARIWTSARNIVSPRFTNRLRNSISLCVGLGEVEFNGSRVACTPPARQMYRAG